MVCELIDMEEILEGAEYCSAVEDVYLHLERERRKKGLLDENDWRWAQDWNGFGHQVVGS
jgi:hypothetical protein